MLDWLQTHGKVRFTLGELVPDSRRVQVSTIQEAIEGLVTDVQQATTQHKTLLNFAVKLKIADLYDRAQQVLDHILADAPEDEDALELRANIWLFQYKYAESAALARHVLAQHPRNWFARTTLTRACEGLAQWTHVIELATESLTLFDDELDRYDAMASRCLAYWRLGDQARSDEDLRTLQGSRRAAFKVRRILRERQTSGGNQV